MLIKIDDFIWCMYVGACGGECEAGRGAAGAVRGESEEGHVRAVHHHASGAHCHLAWGAHLVPSLPRRSNQSSNRSL